MYRKHFSARATPQFQKIPETRQVRNSAKGYTYPVDNWTRLDRFLILGTEGGSYYATEQALTVENAQNVMRCIRDDGVRVVARIAEISASGRASKNDPAIFVLAMCSKYGDLQTKHAAYEAFTDIVRIGTHLFQFNEEVKGFRGRGRWLRRVNTAWYNAKSADALAYQAVKYQQRNGWTHRDLLRLTRPVPPGPEHNAVYRWIVKGETVEGVPRIIEGADIIRTVRRDSKSAAREASKLIREYKLPRETVPTHLLNYPEVWEALLKDMPMTAMIRNLATMTRVGLIAGGSDAACTVEERLTNKKILEKARIHPIAVLSALKTYSQGHGGRGTKSWVPVQSVVDALDDTFYLAFRNVKPANKRWILGVDVSGSMDWGRISGIHGMSPRIAASAMAMITAKTEKEHQIIAFSHKMVPVDISRKKRLDDVICTFSNIPFGGTDCALPMIWALKKKVKADVFVVYTDSETWYGKIHPVQALQQYRDKTGIPAKLVVVGMVGNKFSIADPDDGGMMDVVGFDTATPSLMADFVKG
ncbi:MAG: TROVE domain-containing protein [Desulfobacterales bacterium]|nr:TROVE domain-containing protein [Desulfobacterales bacterium]